jgi:hypothetical protein
MPNTISVEEAEHDLRRILASLSEGERLTVVDETGTPLGTMSPAANRETSSDADQREELDAWMEEMEELARQIDEEWIGEKSALEQLQEDRSRLDPKTGSQNGPDSPSSTSR